MVLDADVVKGEAGADGKNGAAERQQAEPLSLGQRQRHARQCDHGHGEVRDALIEAQNAGLEPEDKLADECRNQGADTGEQNRQEPSAGRAGVGTIE